MSEPQDFVICRECGAKRQFLPAHLKAHNMIITEYLGKHGDVPICSDRYRQNSSRGGKYKRPSRSKKDKKQLTGIEGIDFISCLECGKRFKRISSRHLATHGMSWDEYRTGHPGALMMSEECRKVYSMGILKGWAKKPKIDRSRLTGIETIDFVTCLECDRRMKVISSSHLRKHGITRDGYRKKYLGARLERGTRKSKKRDTIETRESTMWAILWLFGSEPEDFVFCRVCGERFRNMSWSHLKYKHGMTKEEYTSKHPGAPLVSDEYRGALSRGIARRIITEEHRRNLSIAVARRIITEAHRAAFRRRVYPPEKFKRHSEMMRGRTALTHPGNAAQAAKLLGRRKETHPYLARMGEKISALWNDPTYVESISAGEHGLESPHHLTLKYQTRDLLISLGFAVVTERWCVVNKHRYRVDIYAIRGVRTVIAEIGGCDPEKLTNLRVRYGDNNIFHIPYGDEEAIQKIRVECGLV